jgi:mycothiol synthase
VNLPAGYASRPATEGDLDAVVALLEADQLAGMGETDNVREEIVWLWPLAYVDLARDTTVVTAGDELAAYADALWDPASPGPLAGRGAVHPAHLGRGIGASLVGWTREVARERGAPGLRHNGVDAGNAAARTLLEASGFHHVRDFYTMARALPAGTPPPPPDGIAIRVFETGRDERALYENHEATFADHWGFVPEPYESFAAEWFESDDWAPDLAYLAMAGDEVVGHAAALEFAVRGFISSLGVLRPWRGRGIAQALLHRAFSDLAARGQPEVALGVDAASPTRAVALYERVGMTVRHRYVTYDLDTGVASIAGDEAKD